jgi:hypothetical protein
MTTEQTDPTEGVNASAEVGQQEVGNEDWKAWQTRALRAEADAAKYRAQRKDLSQKLNSKTQVDDDYKSLFEQQLAKANKLVDRQKSAEVDSALMEQLTKAGITKDALKAASQLADRNLIEWDEENGVDATGITAAVQKLMAQESWMFERKVAKTDPKQPAEGTSRNANEMTRAEFNKLSPMERVERSRKGVRLTD